MWSVTRQVVNYVWMHPSNRGRRAAALRQAVWWQLHKRLRRTPWDLPVFNGMRLRCYPNSNGASISVYSHGWQDFDTMYFVARYLRPGDNVLDIGANIGVYTLLAASRVGGGGHVTAFEPGEVAYHRLEENVRLNGLDQVDVRRMAVAPHEGHIDFLQSGDLQNRMCLEQDQEGPNGRVASVPCITLGKVLSERPWALAKIDIEGGEPLVLDAARDALADRPPRVWLMEFKPRLLMRFGWTGPQLAGLLHDLGYRLGTYDAVENRLAFAVDPEKEEENLLAVHRDAVDETRNRLETAQLPVGLGP